MSYMIMYIHVYICNHRLYIYIYIYIYALNIERSAQDTNSFLYIYT